MEKSLCRTCPPDLNVIETFRVDAGHIAFWPLHLARLQRTCLKLEIPFDAKAVQAALAALPKEGVLRGRLTVDLAGRPTLGFADLPATKTVWNVAIAPQMLRSDDPWLSVKTTQRGLYDTFRANLPQGIDEWIFLNEQGRLCEGTITNIFVGELQNLRTPPCAAGLLPGVLRQSLLEAGHAYEDDLAPSDLRDGFWIGNALRGLIPAQLVAVERA
ncbi:aminotransferase class IV [Thioclava sp. GXIMD4216]|uniref:aminotransferase class IV n=1 Tax=unclassified Thioclava TaxID=2621713 RepID=UPI0030D3031D